MQKRTLLSFAVMFGLGVAWVLYGYWLFLAAGALWLLMRWRRKPPGAAGEKWRRRAVLLMCVCFFLGALHAAERTAVREARQNALAAADTLTGCGEIVKKEIRQDRIIYHLNGVKLDNRQRSIGSVLLYLDSDNKSQEKEFQIADTVSFAGEPVAFRRAGNEGSYDEASYYGSLGYTGKIYAETVTLEKRAAVPWKEALYQLRCRWQSLYLETLPGEEGGVLSSIALGDKSELLQEVKSLYQASGIAHILAVSGLHVSVVGMFLYRLMRRWGIGFGLGGLISGSLVFLFAQLCGMGVSVLRAAGMFFLYLIAQYLGEAYDSLTALGTMAVLLLWANPFYLQNSGCIFSFGAVFGVSAVALPIQQRYSDWRKKRLEEKYRGYHKKTLSERMFDSVVENFLFSFGIQLFTLPMTALFFYEIPIYSVFLNICILPFMTPLLGLGLAAGLVSSFSMELAGTLLFPCHVILYAYEWICDVSLGLPFSRQILGVPPVWLLLLYYFCLFFALYRLKKGVLRQAALISAVIICFFAPRKSEFEVDVLDVGQGDGIFLSSAEGVHFFIDGGSSSEEDVGTYQILPFLKYKGIRRIDYWFLTHTDEDHVNGFVECVEADYPVKTLVFPKNGAKGEAWEKIASLAERHGINIQYMDVGDRCGTKTLELECLYPGDGKEGEDTNGTSLVLFARFGSFSGLFTGDIGSDQERELCEGLLADQMETCHLKEGGDGRLTFLKAAHHGSNDSNSEKLLELCRPKITAISCARKNSYGHPGEEAVARMEEAETEILLTMELGRIRLTMEKQGIAVDGYLDLKERGLL